MTIAPQEGPQSDFLASEADIVIYGGAAGAGKSYALLMEPTRHIENKKFGAVCFRRETTQITSEGGLWDTSVELYSGFNAKPVKSPKLLWRFSSGAKVSFGHLQHETSVKAWDGSQIALLMFDELQHFTMKQFFYMLSRNRSASGVKPYVRATCNPDPDSWLREFLSWWIDQTTGFPIMERSGIVRYFIRVKGQLYWGASEQELRDKHGKCFPKSFTFIPGNIYDNQALLDVNPEYEANLDALLDYEKARLKGGNWFIRPTAGELFKRPYFTIIDEYDLPSDFEEIMRFWDRAATKPNEENEDPDWTVGLKLARGYDGNYYILDIVRDRLEPGEVEELLLHTTNVDDNEVIVGLEQEPGASGKYETYSYSEKIDDRTVEIFSKTKKNSKLTCWKPVARYSKNSKIFMVKAHWNEKFLSEAEGVTDGTQPGHDDQIDCLAGCYNYLQEGGQGSAGGINVY